MCFFLEPILRAVGLALFGLLHAHNLNYPILNGENELVVEGHECKC